MLEWNDDDLLIGSAEKRARVNGLAFQKIIMEKYLNRIPKEFLESHWELVVL